MSDSSELTRDQLIERFRNLKFLPLSNINNVAYSYEQVSGYKFSTYLEPTFQTYAYVYLSLANGDCDHAIYNDIIRIAFKIQDDQDQPLFTNLTVSEGGLATMTAPEYPNIPTNWNEFCTHLDASTLTGSVKAIVTKSEAIFKVYMHHLCFLLLSFMFKDNKQIMKKVGAIKRGTNLLKVQYNGENAFIVLSDNLKKALRSTAETHLWRTVTASRIIDGYATLKIAGKKDATTYLSWALMTSTHLLGFRTCKLIMTSIEILKVPLNIFFRIIKCDQTAPEIERLLPSCNEIVTTPTDTDLKKWIYYKWSGLIDGNFHSNLKYRCNPFVASLAIGIINGASTTGVVDFVSFPRTCYELNFYKWGEKLSKADRSELLEAGGSDDE